MQFHFLSPSKIQQFVAHRSGETKIGTQVQSASNFDELRKSTATFVILGAEEDAGVRLNQGLGGAHTSWTAFLRAFVNIQVHPELNTEDILILGSWKLEAEMPLVQAVTQLDASIKETVSLIISLGKVPILIGGGHNNCYGMISGAATALGKSIPVINCDPHADLRETIIRHSGNGFSFALKDNFLSRYFVLAMHQAYNNAFIRKKIAENDKLGCSWYEEIFWKEEKSWSEAIREAKAFMKGARYGLELDLDAVEQVLSSAMSPMGISAQQAGAFVYQSAEEALYFHLAEGVQERADGVSSSTIGKLQSYLVQAFIKGKKLLPKKLKQ